MDRFGWERDRSSAAHDRIITDWMDALQDYPLDEIRAACREAVRLRPDDMPNEGHIVAEIMKARAHFVVVNRPAMPRPEPEPERDLPPKERRAEMGAYAQKVLREMAERGKK